MYLYFVYKGYEALRKDVLNKHNKVAFCTNLLGCLLFE